MNTIRRLCLVCILCSCAGAPAAVRAQESRQAEIAAQQAEKAKNLQSYEPGGVEKAIEDLRRRFVDEPSGLFPYFGSVYGGGFMLGAGYRQLYGDASQWYVRGLYSIRQYRLLEVGTVSRGHLDGRLDVSAQVGWRDATELPFFGLGMDTSPSARANTWLTLGFAETTAQLKTVSFVALGGRVAVESFRQQDPLGTFPSVSAVYSPTTAPGLDAEPTYVHTNGSAAIDTRTSPGYSRKGGYYGVAFHNFTDLDDTYNFDRVDVNLVQHLPIMRETWVLSLRGRVQSILDDTDLVPFFQLPALGSGDSLRAYQSWRFRDRHSLLTSAEFRWFPNKNFLDMAFFYDAGKVTSRRRDLDFDGLKSNWGVGARFHGPAVTAMRVELTRGSEGWNSVFSADAAF
jgi:hypothetical protein